MSASNYNCGGCDAVITDRRFLKCSVCLLRYDLMCANVSEKRFVGSMTREHKEKWKCVTCKSQERKGDNTNTPVRACEAGVTVRRGASARSPVEQEEEPTDMQTLIMEFRRFREEMKATRISIESLNSTLTNLSTRVDDCDRRVDQLAERMVSLEKRIDDGVSGSQTGSDSLLQSIQQLKSELNDRDQELLLNDVELSCIPEVKGEGLHHVVLGVAKKLGVELAATDIVSVARVGRLPAEEGTGRPRHIVVRVARRALRDQLLAAARVRRGATTEGLDLPAPPRRFYVNERLTKANRELFRRARERAARLNWRFVWTREGRIYARQHHGRDAIRHRLRSEDDLLRVFGQDIVSSAKV